MNPYYATFLLLVSTISLTAQTGFQPAVLTTIEGRTIIGKVKYENWNTTPQKILFQPESGAEQKYEIADLKAFEVTRHDGLQEYFLRQTVNVDTSSLKRERLEFKSQPSFRTETVWLQVYFAGSDTLLLLKNKDKIHYLIKFHDKYEELIMKKYLQQTAEGEDKIVVNSLYKRQLMDLPDNC